MKWRKVTVEKLAEDSLLSTKTIQRMRNDLDREWPLGMVVAVCIGLSLPPYVSSDLVVKAGFAFKPTEEHVTYRHLLTVHYDNSIIECNEVLEAAGFKPIGREE
jgi:hypothetical protein